MSATPYGDSVNATAAGMRTAQCNAPAPADAPCGPVPLPADLSRVVAAWPSLPPAVRAGVLAMVDASASAEGE